MTAKERNFALSTGVNLFCLRRSGSRVAGATLVALLCMLAVGCDRNEIKVYNVAKSSGPTANSLPSGHPDIHSSPRLTWQTPEGWTELPGSQMRVGSFSVKEGDKQADVSVIPLGGIAGGDLANVNRWRVEQLGLKAVTADGLKQLAEPVEIAGRTGDLYDLVGTNPGSGDPTRILGAIQHRDGTAWFFKMSGDDELVAKQKNAFIAFLKSVQFGVGDVASGLPAGHPPIGDSTLPAGHPPIGDTTLPVGHPEISQTSSAANAPATSDQKSKSNLPAGWRELPAGQFLIAKYGIGDDAGSQATVNVSISGGDLAMNVNRWRGQLQQAPWSESELKQNTKEVEVAAGRAIFVEMNGTDASTGRPAALVGAIVPKGGQSLFFKLMGDVKVVEAQKEAFERFVREVKY